MSMQKNAISDAGTSGQRHYKQSDFNLGFLDTTGTQDLVGPTKSGLLLHISINWEDRLVYSSSS